MDQQSDLLPATAEIRPAIILQRVLRVGPNGFEPVDVPVITKQAMQQAYYAIAAQPYLSSEPDPFHPDHEFDGMLTAEVIIRKHVALATRGQSREDIESVLDRLMDRPKQSSENVNLTGNYETLLKKLAAEERQRRLVQARPVETGGAAAALEEFE